MEQTNKVHWQLFGKWKGTREMLLRTLEVYEDRDNVLAESIDDYGKNWELWLECFPIEHPHAALRRRLAGVNLPTGKGPENLRLAPEEGIPEGWVRHAFSDDPPPAAPSADDHVVPIAAHA